MTKVLKITEARKKLLTLPEELQVGDVVEIVRHGNVVLKISRPAFVEGGEERRDPFALLDQALSKLSQKSKKNPPKDLAKNYKKYLYGKMAL